MGRGRGRGRRRRGGGGSAGASERKRTRLAVEEEVETGEDYCFVCKDGGELRVCDFRSCNKAYHPGCVGKDSDFLTSDEEFICEWHTCFICKGRSRYHCFCCPWYSFCQGCLAQAEFAPVLRKTKGFCINCLSMAIMIEKNIDVDSDGEIADFSARDTYEFLFKDYWKIVKDKEVLTLDKLEEAHAFMKKGLNCKQEDVGKVPDEERNSDTDFLGNSDDGDGDDEPCYPSYSNGASKKIKSFLKEGKSKKNGHMGWGSEVLMEFISSVGKDTSNSLDQFGAAQIVREYIRQNNLLQKDKKKLVLCDGKLRSLFRKSKVKYNKIPSLLKKHITVNMESEDETFISSEDNNDSAMTKKPRTVNYVSSTPKGTSEINKRCLASLESDNIKLIYLKRSLIMNLLKEPDTFESKVTGCFVRIKNDPKDYSYYILKKPYQLGQVTGIRKSSEEYKIRDISTDVLLCISNLYDVRISMLSDEDFEKDECEDLHIMAQKGFFKRLTVGDFEEKARSIHRDIASHWIDKEIQILQKLIDMAHEKGWRNQMYAYMDKKKLLREPSEKRRRLEEVPQVIPDMKDSKDTESLVPPEDKSVQNNAAVFQVGEDVDFSVGTSKVVPILKKCSEEKSKATKEDADGSTVGMNVQKQDTEDTEVNTAGEIPCAPKQDSEAIEVDANGNSSSMHVQRQSTEANKTNAASNSAIKADTNGDSSAMRVQRQSTEVNKSNVASNAATKADANCDLSAIHVQRKSTEANKSNAASDTLGIFVQKEGAEAVDAGVKTQVIIDLEADENLYERGGQTAIIDLEADDARDTLRVQHKTNNTLRRGIPLPTCAWYYMDPQGEEQGPFAIERLRDWWHSNYFPENFKVWREGQTSDSAVFLRDVLY